MLRKVALEHLLRTDFFLSSGRRENRYLNESQSIFWLEKRWYREIHSIRPFMANGVFYFLDGLEEL
ncbi:hypothetical protein C0966_10515 [Bacillus methanolicus]|nr:hypothetical protein [Bacillus methanolicus]